MLVRRRLLATVGGLDAERVGLGYGEEVDLCLRAAAAGFGDALRGSTGRIPAELERRLR
jgi:GT2 family glycosyltransferase